MARQNKVQIYEFLFVTSLLLVFVDIAACQCLKAETSEGYVDLQEGQTACAPLESGETQDDKGKRFVTCIHKRCHVQLCPPGLRYVEIANNIV
uniref:Uncharacterized protein n=1 Tax=Arion vulgaris TaxID=1028688 RepID=A0A0B6Y117_9EUPU